MCASARRRPDAGRRRRPRLLAVASSPSRERGPESSPVGRRAARLHETSQETMDGVSRGANGADAGRSGVRVEKSELQTGGRRAAILRLVLFDEYPHKTNTKQSFVNFCAEKKVYVLVFCPCNRPKSKIAGPTVGTRNGIHNSRNSRFSHLRY